MNTLESPLHRWHAELGADLTDSETPYPLPRNYGDPVQEHGAVRGAAGIVDEGFLAALRIEGGDRVEFLQGMVSNDVKGLNAGTGCHAASVNLQGRIIADLHLFALPDAFLALTHVTACRNLVEHLDRYVISSDVIIKDLSGETWVIGLHGPRASSVVGRVLDGMPPEAAPHLHGRVVREDAAVHWLSTKVTGEPGFHLLVPRDRVKDLWEALLRAGEGEGLHALGTDAFHTLRLEAGVPWFGRDFDGTTIPLEAGLDDAVSFTKGCFLGQEVLARIHYQGKPARLLVGIEVEGNMPPEAGSPVLFQDSGKGAGKITSAAFGPTVGRVIALAMLKREAAAEGTPLTVQFGENPVAARVVPLPFRRRGSQPPE